jgi:hypothetical protein
MLRFKTQERLIEELNRQIEFSQGAVNKWAEELTTNPLHAFEWSESAVKSAATLTVATRILNTITQDVGKNMNGEPVTYEEACAYLVKAITAKLLHAGRYPERSTSVSSNFAKQEEISAYAEALERYFGGLDY